MGKLDAACCYLSGAMEFVSDHGVGWRRKMTEIVRSSDLQIDLVDPTNKPGGETYRIGEDKETQVRLQQEGRFNELRDYVHRYRRFDLRFVDLCDFLVVAVDPTVPQWGTANEVYFGELQHKPMFFINPGGLSDLPRWLFDIVDIGDNGRHSVKERCNVFTSVEEVVEELILLDSGAIPMSDEWVLIRQFIECDRRNHVEINETLLPSE